MTTLKWFNVALRGIMEAGIVLALGFWGCHTGRTTTMKILLSIIIPLIGFGFWGLVDFHQFGRLSEWLRLLQELVISGLAAFALYSAGQRALCWSLFTLSIVHHALVYLSGERLLKKPAGKQDQKQMSAK